MLITLAEFRRKVKRASEVYQGDIASASNTALFKGGGIVPNLRGPGNRTPVLPFPRVS